MRHLCILGVEVPQLPHVGNWRDKFFKEREGKYRVEGSFIE